MKTLKAKKPRQPKSIDDHILPLINIVFLLLIFFLIAGRLTSSDPFELSPAYSFSDTREKNEDAIIHLSKTGEIAFQNNVMPRETLLKELSEHMTQYPDSIPRLKINGDHNGVFVLGLMQEMQKQGIKKIALITQREKP